ncbi:MAG: clostripain-related cysteine peptidase, partial [Armatimonadetes bacterium]|nr:clostripain-related cysteine peptidase [Armatimonadota bacterium]
MSHALAVSLAAVAALVGPARGDSSDRWLVALYLAGDSDLWQTAQYAASRIVQAAPSPDLAMLLDGPPGQASRGRVWLRTRSDCRQEDWGRLNTGAAATLRRFCRRAQAESQAARRALLILGHGQPLAEEADPWRAVVRAGGLGVDWSAGSDCLTPAEVEAALAGQSWDVVVLACCYGMSVEMGWSLRHTGGLVAAAP